jgi:hypothetical protein
LAGEEAGAASALGKTEKIIATAGTTTAKVFIWKGLGGFDRRVGIVSNRNRGNVPKRPGSNSDE